MYYLYLFLLLTLPLPVCLILYRYFEEATAKLSGSLTKNITFNLSGVIVVYAAIVFLGCIALTPDLLNMRNAFFPTKWEYEHQLTSKTVVIDSELDEASRMRAQNKKAAFTFSDSGKILIYYKSNSIVTVKNITDGMRHLEFTGLLDKGNIYIPFDLEKSDLNLIIYGRFNNRIMHLPIDTLFKRNNDIRNPLHGKIEMRRIWPFISLIIFIYFPVVIVFLLSKISPLVFNLAVKKSLTKKSLLGSEGKNEVGLNVGGAIASYFVLFGFLVLVNGLNNNVVWKEAQDETLAICEKMHGMWFYKAYASEREKAVRKALEHVADGELSISCDNGILNINGFYYRHQDDLSKRPAAENRLDWEVISLGVDRNQVLAVYQTGNFDKTYGLFTGIINADKQSHSLYFHEFENKADEFFMPVYGKLIMSRIKEESYGRAVNETQPGDQQ